MTTNFCKVSLLATPKVPGMISVCHKASWGSWGSFAFRRAPRKLAFLAVLTRFKALPRRRSLRLPEASRVSQTNKANWRRALQTFRKASPPQGTQGGGACAW